MIFTELTLENFGLYAGVQRLNLTPDPGRPVVLIGGTNGSGKTTLLEAFTLCLYGRRALGLRISNERYDGHIVSRMHAAPNEPRAEEAAVSLVFDHNHAGRTSKYEVSRRWESLANGKVRERLLVAVDGVEVDAVADGSGQAFLDSLLPPGLAGFFLFDGEQIQSLADDENGEQLADAVRRLLGLDLIGQLRADLRRVATLGDGRRASTFTDQVTHAETAVVEAREKVGLVTDDLAVARARRDQLGGRIERIRDRLTREGGALAAERARLETDARSAAADVAAAEEELRAYIAGPLPFAITQNIAQSLDERLRLEQDHEEDDIVLRRVESHAAALSAGLRANDDRPVVAVLTDLLGGERAGREARRHDMSAAERAILLNHLHGIQDGVRADAARLAHRVRQARQIGDRAELQLQQVPDDQALAGIITELQEVERELGAVDAGVERSEDDLRQAQYEHKVAERTLLKAESAAADQNKAARSTDLALRTARLLEEYGERAEAMRLAQVELAATTYFNRLSRKGELLSAIKIDRETFRVAVIRWDGTELPKTRLSAGEKQLFAIAILWALAKTSRRPLPVVIDTPLARLDKEHRDRLLTEYLPHVSHQVVVLSTDTEVDDTAAVRLESVTTRRLFLEHDSETASTSVQVGYFNRGLEVAAGAR